MPMPLNNQAMLFKKLVAGVLLLHTNPLCTSPKLHKRLFVSASFRS